MYKFVVLSILQNSQRSSINFRTYIFLACPNIIGREDWGGLRPTFVEYIPSPVQNVIIHHTVTPPCFNIDDCSDRIVSMQRYHMNTIGCGDIGYR